MRFPIPNRCDEATRALAAPGAGVGGPGPEDVAEHLAACPRCAAWAEKDAALTRLWESTRPVEPSENAWDALWARVSDRLDRPAAPVAEPEPVAEPAVVAMPAWPRGRVAVGLFVAAQAAAILAALTLAVTHRPAPGGGGAAALTASLPDVGATRNVRTVALRGEYETETDEVVLFREDEQGLHPVELALDDRSNTLDGYYAMYNAFEAMAE